MSHDAADHGEDLTVLCDLGSTFTKAVCVTSCGRAVSRARSATARDRLGQGFTRATHAALSRFPGAGRGRRVTTVASSSAAGGLRLCVVGLEPALTVAAGRQAAATAGARVVAAYSAAKFGRLTDAAFAAAAPDVVLLTGGINHGDVAGIIGSARVLRRLAPGVPLLVAGNEDAYPELRRVLAGLPLVSYLPNLLPRVGSVRTGPVQQAIRSVFAEHVIGRGRFVSAAGLSGIVRMPTPAAVLAGASALAGLAGRHPWLRHPVVVDVGGATTDVHSVLGDGAARSVEGDLGLRENADTLLDAAQAAGLAGADEPDLRAAARYRREHQGYLPSPGPAEAADRRLAEMACVLALERHAGMLRARIGADGGTVRATGRDLREASCVIGTGGIFAHDAAAAQTLTRALRVARARGALVPADPAVTVDRDYLLWAAGLLCSDSASAGTRLAARWASRPGSQPVRPGIAVPR